MHITCNQSFLHKKALPWSFAFALFLLCIPLKSLAAVTDTARFFDNLRYKLANSSKISIAYLGGSITQGQGASNRAVTSWRPLTTTWFKTNYPKVTVTEIDASWGATGSDLGAFRCTRDVCSKNPDLVFVEFAVNDWQKSSADIQPYMDGIVRNIWRTLPKCVIVFVYAVHNNTIANYDKGTSPPAVLSQQAVADHYNVCTINMGKAMWQAIKDGKGSLDTYTADGTHATDAGYKIYADEITGVLKRHLLVPAVPAACIPAELPQPLVSNTVDNGVIIMADKLSFSGWKNAAVDEVRFPNQISCNKPATRLSYTFKGTAFGMYWVPGTDGGQMQWSIDNSTPVKMSGYAATPRGSFPVLTNKLSPGSHTIVMEVLSTKDAASTGNYIRMGAFFVDEDVEAVSASHHVRPAVNSTFFSVTNGPFALVKPGSFILNTSVSDLFSVTQVGLSGEVISAMFTGKLCPGSHLINMPTGNTGAAGYSVLRITSAQHGQLSKQFIRLR